MNDHALQPMITVPPVQCSQVITAFVFQRHGSRRFSGTPFWHDDWHDHDSALPCLAWLRPCAGTIGDIGAALPSICCGWTRRRRLFHSARTGMTRLRWARDARRPSPVYRDVRQGAARQAFGQVAAREELRRPGDPAAGTNYGERQKVPLQTGARDGHGGTAREGRHVYIHVAPGTAINHCGVFSPCGGTDHTSTRTEGTSPDHRS